MPRLALSTLASLVCSAAHLYPSSLRSPVAVVLHFEHPDFSPGFCLSCPFHSSPLFLWARHTGGIFVFFASDSGYLYAFSGKFAPGVFRVVLWRGENCNGVCLSYMVWYGSNSSYEHVSLRGPEAPISGIFNVPGEEVILSPFAENSYLAYVFLVSF
eukprot:3543413-Pleurochrysis_carterae.AAC.1